MGIVVDKITLAGFGSYGKAQSLTLGGNGPVAIIGDNGTGKSTAVSKGLTWALYGKCPPERMGSGTRAISGRAVVGTGQKTATVTVTLRDASSVWTVKRQRARSGGETLTVRRNGKKADDATQTTIETLVGADYDTWCRTVVRGQGDPWSFAEATDGRKREILDAISGARSLEEACERAKHHRSVADAKHRDATRRAEDLRLRWGTVNLQQTQDKLDRWTADHAQKIEGVSKTVAALEGAAKDARSEKGDNPESLDEIEKRKPTLDRAPYQQAVTEAQATFDAASREWSVVSHDQKRLSQLSLGDPCPTCEQAVGPIVAEKLATSQKSAAEAKGALVAARDVLDDNKRIMREAVEWIDDAMDEWSAVRSAARIREGQIGAVERELKQARDRLSDLGAVVNPYQSRLEADTQREEQLRREAALADETAAQARWVVEAAQAWQAALGPKGVRAHMAESALAAIETAANRWLAILSDRGLAVEFPPTREVKGRLKEEIKTIVHIDDNGEHAERDLLTFSGGERRRLNLAVDLGVAAVCGGGGLALSLLVLDEEVFSGMDEHGKAAVVEALHSAGVADVVIIDHDPRLSSTLPRTIKVTRGPKGHSVLEELTND